MDGSAGGGHGGGGGGGGGDFATLFEVLPIGAYRSRPDGTMLRANAALVRLNGYESEGALLAGVRDIAREWYVLPERRAEFQRLIETEGRVVAFVSEIWRHRTRERIWISENAVAVRDARGAVVAYEGTVEEITDRIRTQQALALSEARLQQLVSLVPGVVYRLAIRPDGSRCYTFVSDGVRGMYGIEPAEALADGEALVRRRHPAQAERLRAASQAAIEGRQPLALESHVRLDDGTEKWLQVVSAPAPPEDGNEVRVGMILDITARKRAETALQEQATRWKAALEAAGDGVWDWRIDSGEELLSPECLALYGFAPGELPERADALDDRTHPDDLAAMRAARAAHFEGRSPRYVNEHRVRHKDGPWIWVLSRGMVIERDATGRPLRMVGTHTDITARKQAEALRAERDRAAAADLAKTQFLSRVSHELRTPLNAILGFGQLLELQGQQGGLDERARGWVGQLLGSGRHLLALMDDILDLSAAQSGKLPLAPEALVAAPLVAQAWQMLEAAAAQGGIVLQSTPALDGAPALLADRRRLLQVLVNLLSNAIKYNRPGGWVRVDARHDATQVWLHVADSGLGLDAEQRARLFQPFERLGAQRSGVAGTGLGLAFSRELVTLMGGAIEVASEPGEGSVFSVRLPRG